MPFLENSSYCDIEDYSYDRLDITPQTRSNMEMKRDTIHDDLGFDPDQLMKKYDNEVNQLEADDHLALSKLLLYFRA